MYAFVLAESSLIMPQPGLAIWTLITFVLVALFLRAKVWGPLLAMLEQREKTIQDAIDQAAKEREEAARLVAEQQSAAEKARKEAAEMVRQSRAEVDKAKQELMARAKADADALLAQARKQIEDETRKALAEVRSAAVDIALAAASKLIAGKIDEQADRRLAEEYIGQLPQQPLGGSRVAQG